MKRILYLFSVLVVYLGSSCDQRKSVNQTAVKEKTLAATTFQEDVRFLEKFTDLDMLKESTGKGMIAVSRSLQARVMTSTSDGENGRSYGWINRDLFESRDTLPHINPFGGEERFWLGPEGGQFSVFFKKDDPFDLEHWQTPALIDLEAFELKSKSETKADYYKSGKIVNYSGFTFDFNIERSVEVMSQLEVFNTLGLTVNELVKVVGYQTTNTLTNTGDADWRKETGLLSIWLLGMFNPSDATTIMVPFVEGEESLLGPAVNDDYFGKVPPDRLKVGEGILFFSGDGRYRSKIGLSPKRARDLAASYDASSQSLTIVKYQKPEGITDYVNSLWEIQQEPYSGDVINSYNDGPPEPGKNPLGPFYELETSSPALALKTGESGTHIQQTFHFEGKEEHLKEITLELLGVSISDIKQALP